MSSEFPFGAAEPPNEMNRRSFVQLVGATIALAGLGGCLERPREKILPYVGNPPELTPGLAQYYATSMVLGGYATGLLVESHSGRPTKVEGNPDHPASLGASGVYEQASVLQLYDPHRARQPRHLKGNFSWESFQSSMTPKALRPRVGDRGAGLRVLLEPTASPSIGAMLDRLRELYPDVGVHFYAPLTSDHTAVAGESAFGRPLQPVYDFTQADVVLALDADFLSGMPFHLRYAHDFAQRRRIGGPSDAMNRLYLVETAFSPTGTLADHRFRTQPSSIPEIALSLLSELGHAYGLWPGGMPAGLKSSLEPLRADSAQAHWVGAVAGDLAAHKGHAIVIAGERQPVSVQLLTHLINSALGSPGQTVRYIDCPLLEAGKRASTLAPLVDALQAGGVDTLLVLEGNPSYSAPADFEFSRRLRQARNTVYLGLYENETARDSKTFVPALHYLEAWGDARAYDGTASLVQPLIAPLYGGRTPAELLAALLEEGSIGGHDLVRRHWSGRMAKSEAGRIWDQALQRGVLPDSSVSGVVPTLEWGSIAKSLFSVSVPRPSDGGVEVMLLPDPKVYDGSFSNNPWLQELPDPVTKLTWDNAAMLSPATAASIGVETGELLELELQGRRLVAPVLLVPGHADRAISINLGYGRRADAEPVARGVGFDAYGLRTSQVGYALSGVGVRRVLEGKAPVRHALAITQTHWTMDGRPLALQATLEGYRRNPDFTRAEKGRTLSLYQPRQGGGAQWAMVIDQSLCSGCGGCEVACQAENNVPVVGKEGVLNSREMHWLRIDRYLSGPDDDPQVIAQPMLCQHCEQAPCEYVCPVSATKHSPDGLNEMVYNRCVGTRFCSNNCPYKVRRFNWFNYNAQVSETEAMSKNPDVTVRARGVMEKCTFCVQRIRAAEIDARIAGHPIEDGTFTTACAQACPTGAIVFGSFTDPEAEVARRAAEPRGYAVLHELGTEPRVRYLARITNPNPALSSTGHDV